MALPAKDSPEILPADPGARRRALTLVVVGGAAGILAIEYLLPWARGRLAQAVYDGSVPRSAICKSVLMGLMVVATSVAGFGVYAFRLGRRVLSEERFPPAGTKVVRDTRVLRGRAARILGRAQAINGALLVLLALALFLVCAYGYLELALR